MTLLISIKIVNGWQRVELTVYVGFLFGIL
jgi:hypothetical protein